VLLEAPAASRRAWWSFDRLGTSGTTTDGAVGVRRDDGCKTEGALANSLHGGRPNAPAGSENQTRPPLPHVACQPACGRWQRPTHGVRASICAWCVNRPRSRRGLSVRWRFDGLRGTQAAGIGLKQRRSISVSEQIPRVCPRPRLALCVHISIGVRECVPSQPQRGHRSMRRWHPIGIRQSAVVRPAAAARRVERVRCAARAAA
jgi:hypothetical protein